MKWLKFSIDTTADGIAPVCEKLSALGIDAVEIEDSDDFNNFLEQNKPFWELADDDFVQSMQNRHRVSFYLPDNGYVKSASVSVSDEADWIDAWKAHYRPIPVGGRLLIQPEWIPTENPDNRAVFLCDPGVSFGTGNHTTTRLVLEMLDKHVKSGAKIADLGCGSGILAVCAMLLGAASAFAADIDPLAVKIAAENAVRNNIALTVKELNLLQNFDVPRDNDIICANLVLELIEKLAENLHAHLPRGGRLFASGILAERAEDARAVLENVGFAHEETLTRDGWCALNMVKL